MKKIVTLLLTGTVLIVSSTAGYGDTATSSTAAKQNQQAKCHKHNKKCLCASCMKHHKATDTTNTTQNSKATTTPAVSFDATDTKVPTIEKTHWIIEHTSGFFDFTSNYIFRGISQTSDLPAVQGGLKYTTDIGLYGSLSGSNSRYLDPHGNYTSVAFNYIVGVKNKVGDNFTYDINVNRYSYPRTIASYNELIGSFSYSFLTAFVGYSADAFAYHVRGLYTNLGFNLPVSPKIAYFDNVYFSGGIGHYSLQRAAGHSYNDYNLQLAKLLYDKYAFAIQWTDTNGAYQNHPYDQSKVVALIAVLF